LLQFSLQKVADVSALASWYCEAENYDQPIIVIIDDLEQCSGDVLGELVMMLRYHSSPLVYASIFHADPNINKYKL
jgi:ATP/maltotriose-dependent transcriptional regulator MalT